MSYFTQIKNKYQEIPQDGGIITDSFLDACIDSILPFFDILGPTTFAALKADVNGNITKLRKRYLTDPNKYEVLTAMVEHEVENGTTTQKNSATDALMWLTRTLNFVATIMLNVLKDETGSLVVCIQDAYQKCLKPFHGWMVQKIVTVALKACPYKEHLTKQLANGVDDETLAKDMEEFHRLLSSHVDIINRLYTEKELGGIVV